MTPAPLRRTTALAITLAAWLSWGCEAFPELTRCGPDQACPSGLVCGADGVCASPETDGGREADGGGAGDDVSMRDAAPPVDQGPSGPDAGVDAAPAPDAGVVSLDAEPGPMGDSALDAGPDALPLDATVAPDVRSSDAELDAATDGAGDAAVDAEVDAAVVALMDAAPEPDAACVPVDEVCDGADQDCDGRIDESATDACGACGLDALGACAVGRQVCVDGALVCRSHLPVASPAACNRVDDDCDGRVDEGDDARNDRVPDPEVVAQCGPLVTSPVVPSAAVLGGAAAGACDGDPVSVGCGPIHGCLDRGCLTACDDARAAAVSSCADECADAVCRAACLEAAAPAWRACHAACEGALPGAATYRCADADPGAAVERACTLVTCGPGFERRGDRCVRPEICNNGVDEDEDGLVDGTIARPEVCAAVIPGADVPFVVGTCPRPESDAGAPPDCLRVEPRPFDQCAGDDCPKRVTLDYGFALDAEEVSVRAYLQCVERGCCRAPTGPLWSVAEATIAAGMAPAERPPPGDRCEDVAALIPNQVYPEVFDLPVSGVSWCDARDYCQWAGKRLVTETEFERAGAGLPARAYPWGDTPPSRCRTNQCCVDDLAFDGDLPPVCDEAHLLMCPPDAPAGETGVRPACLGTYGLNTDTCVNQLQIPAGTFFAPAPVWSNADGATAEGAFNLLGNVGEWTFDWASVNWGHQADTNPVGPSCSTIAPPSRRITRGGSIFRDGDTLTVSRRSSHTPGTRLPNVGFRCARTLEEDLVGEPRLCDPGRLGSTVSPEDECRARLSGRVDCAAPDFADLRGPGVCPEGIRFDTSRCDVGPFRYCSGELSGCNTLVMTRMLADVERLLTLLRPLSIVVDGLDDLLTEFERGFEDNGTGEGTNDSILNADQAGQGGTSFLAFDAPCDFTRNGTHEVRLFNGALDSASPRPRVLGIQDEALACQPTPTPTLSLTTRDGDVSSFCTLDDMEMHVRGMTAAIRVTGMMGYLLEKRDAPLRLEGGLVMVVSVRDVEQATYGDAVEGGLTTFFRENEFDPQDLCFLQSLAVAIQALQADDPDPFTAALLAQVAPAGWDCDAFTTWPGCQEGVCVGVPREDGSMDREGCTGWAFPLSFEAVHFADAPLGFTACDDCEAGQ